jgi:hypothetical protein
MKSSAMGLPFSCLFLILTAGHAFSQRLVPGADSRNSQEITLHSSTNLVLLDVIAESSSGVPDNTLKRDDFVLFDNGHRVSIKTFDIGAEPTVRPLTLWFVVQCKMRGWELRGSGLFAGQIHLLEAGLSHLDTQDRVAVAHWCDNGDAQIDLEPTGRIDQATSALEHVLAPEFEVTDHGRTGELALQKTLRIVTAATQSAATRPIPVLIFLYGDYSGMPRSEADHFIHELLTTSAIVFGLRDERSPKIGSLWMFGEQSSVAKYMANQTGGAYLSVTPETYANALERILLQLHSRYELGFEPKSLDGKRHRLRIKLTAAAAARHTGLRLRYRAAYIATPSTLRK